MRRAEEEKVRQREGEEGEERDEKKEKRRKKGEESEEKRSGERAWEKERRMERRD